MDTTNIILLIGFFLVVISIIVVSQGIDKINKNLESIKNLIQYYAEFEEVKSDKK